MRHESYEELGLVWQTPAAGYGTARAQSVREGLFVFKKNLAGIAWNTLSTLENNPATLPQTETILQGRSVGGLSMDELLQVRQYAQAAHELARMVHEGTFALSSSIACALHAIIGREEALEWGVFRTHQVHIQHVAHVPPVAESLDALAAQGFAFLAGLDDVPERALLTFLWMSRNQFFYDCNKRTASLMMNGVLLQAGFYPLAVLASQAERFNILLRDFYNTGNATSMLDFLAAMYRMQYTPS